MFQNYICIAKKVGVKSPVVFFSRKSRSEVEAKLLRLAVKSSHISVPTFSSISSSSYFEWVC